MSAESKTITNCRECRSSFVDWACRNRQFCSPSCSTTYRNKQRTGLSHPNWTGGNLIERICLGCEKPFMARKRSIVSGNGKFCSHQCAATGLFNKMSGKTGESNPNWRGGITPINKLIRGSSQYKEWRKSVFERDQYTCTECGQWGGKLNADHIKPFSIYPDLRFDIDNGRTLCQSCHRATETWGINAIKMARRVS